MQKTNAKMDGAIFNIHIKTSQIDLDPTTNDDLHIHAWKQLVGKIEKKKKRNVNNTLQFWIYFLTSPKEGARRINGSYAH